MFMPGIKSSSADEQVIIKVDSTLVLTRVYTRLHTSPKIGGLDIDPLNNSLYAEPSDSPRRD